MGAPSPFSFDTSCLDTAPSSLAMVKLFPSGEKANARTLDLPPVLACLGGTNAGDRSFKLSVSNTSAVSPLGPIVASNLPSGDTAARTRSVGNACK